MIWPLVALTLFVLLIGIVRFLGRPRPDPEPRKPRPWTLPGGTVAHRIEPTAMMERERIGVAVEVGVEPQPVQWYVVPESQTKGWPDPRFTVEAYGLTRTTHGFAQGSRIALSPHGRTAPATIRHELKHVYGESHDDRGGWRG